MWRKANGIVQLIKRQLKGVISQTEQKKLNEWANRSIENRALLDALCNEQQIDHFNNDFSIIDIDTGWKKVQQGIRRSNLPSSVTQLHK